MNTQQTFENGQNNIFETMFQSPGIPPINHRFSSLHSLNRTRSVPLNNINTLNEIMIGYNNNIHAYNENIRIFLEIMESNRTNLRDVSNVDISANIQPNQTSNQEPSPEIPPDINNVFNNIFANVFQQSPFRNINSGVRTAYYSNNIPNRLSDVVVRPTDEQLRNALEDVIYNPNEINITTCPITLENFIEGEVVKRIKHCGHIFSSHSINNWFSRHVRCPVCRYDIRDYASSVPAPNNVDNREEEISNELINVIGNNITNIFENFANNFTQNTDISNGLIYQIGIIPNPNMTNNT
jgi:hypothetical protein